MNRFFSKIPTLNRGHASSANEISSTAVSVARASATTAMSLLHITQGATAILLVSAPPIGAAVVCLAALVLKTYDLFKNNEELMEMLDEITFYVVELHEYAESIKQYYATSTSKNEYIYFLEHMIRLSVTIQLLNYHKESTKLNGIIVFTPNFYITEIMKQLTFINTSFMIILSKVRVDVREITEVSILPQFDKPSVPMEQSLNVNQEIETLNETDMQENIKELNGVVKENKEDESLGKLFQDKVGNMVNIVTESLLNFSIRGGKTKTKRKRNRKTKRKTIRNRKTKRKTI
jgi:hypothetical protein